MQQKNMMTAYDVAEVLGISLGQAYKTIRELNPELRASGYYTVQAKCQRLIGKKNSTVLARNRRKNHGSLQR